MPLEATVEANREPSNEASPGADQATGVVDFRGIYGPKNLHPNPNYGF